MSVCWGIKGPLALATITVIVVLHFSVLIESMTTDKPGETPCSIFYNATAMVKDNSTGFGNFHCYKTTYPEGVRNVSISDFLERLSCLTKCYLQWIGTFDESGEYNPKPTQQFYEKYTNATADYINEILASHEQCVEQANMRIESLKQNGTVVNPCKFYSLFQTCATLKMFKGIKKCRLSLAQ